MTLFLIGLKALKRAVLEQKPLDWHKHKVNASLFTPGELDAFEWVNNHLHKYHQLPQPETFASQFPETKQFDCPETFTYYLDHLQQRYAYGVINKANIDSQTILKNDKGAIKDAQMVLSKALEDLQKQAYRTKVMDLAKDAPAMVVGEYHNAMKNEVNAEFGWTYLDEMTGGALPGDVISYVGRPAMGKTWKVLYGALYNWRKGRSVMVTSMEMNVLAIAQRLAAMYTHTPIGQLKLGAFASPTYQQFAQGLVEMAGQNEQNGAKFYVVDGNLAAATDDIYMLASQLGVSSLYIDGAYLLKHPNLRLDRFTRVAENVELMKQRTTSLEIPTFASWQLNREAAKNNKKSGQKAGLEDIGYSDAIGQISSIVLALMQEEGVETMNQRIIDVLKGRSGEVGQFNINWNFNVMDFSQVGTGEDDDFGSGSLDYI